MEESRGAATQVKYMYCLLWQKKRGILDNWTKNMYNGQIEARGRESWNSIRLQKSLK